MFLNLHVRIYVGFLLVGELHFLKESNNTHMVAMGRFVSGHDLELTLHDVAFVQFSSNIFARLCDLYPFG